MKNPLQGCTVEKLPESPGVICFAYRIISRGKEFMLMRNKVNPYMLFVVGPSMASKLKGWSWFCDGDKTNGPGSKDLSPSH